MNQIENTFIIKIDQIIDDKLKKFVTGHQVANKFEENYNELLLKINDSGMQIMKNVSQKFEQFESNITSNIKNNEKNINQK